MSESAKITRKAKSNLAFALRFLPAQQKTDMTSFYAFCRVVDDLSDDREIPLGKRKANLHMWKLSVMNGSQDSTGLKKEIEDIIQRYEIPRNLFEQVIVGCESDLQSQRFQNWDQLKGYCYRVAGCVGVISTYILGCKNEASRKYAVKLGYALQLTNIIRDVAEDLSNGQRIYLPLDVLARYNYNEKELHKKIYDTRFVAVMTVVAERAEGLYKEAVSLLPEDDANALKAAEAMRKIYYALLQKMKKDKFQVFKKRYKVSALQKTAILFSTMKK